MLLIAVLCGGLSGVAASTGTAGAAASNGEAAKSPTEILADAAAAIGSTNGVLISGTVQGDNGRVTISLVSGQGAGGGVMFINGARIDLVLAPPNVYMKGSEGAWASITGNDAAATLLAGKWIQGTTADENFAGLASLADISKMSESLLKPDGAVTKGPVTVYHGKKAIPLMTTAPTRAPSTSRPRVRPIRWGSSRTTPRPERFASASTARCTHRRHPRTP